MVNTEEFIDRMQQVLTYYNLSASLFADKIGVQRSSISHILSGRNKPSLDFIMKILDAFPEVELYWLLNGKGEFPGKGNTSPRKMSPEPSLFDDTEEDKPLKADSGSTLLPVSVKNSEIARIVIFYKDGTFEMFTNKNDT